MHSSRAWHEPEITCAVGMLKLLFHRETGEILGVHCFGANAADIIHIGQAIMKQPPRIIRSLILSTPPSIIRLWLKPIG